MKFRTNIPLLIKLLNQYNFPERGTGMTPNQKHMLQSVRSYQIKLHTPLGYSCETSAIQKSLNQITKLLVIVSTVTNQQSPVLGCICDPCTDILLEETQTSSPAPERPTTTTAGTSYATRRWWQFLKISFAAGWKNFAAWGNTALPPPAGLWDVFINGCTIQCAVAIVVVPPNVHRSSSVVTKETKSATAIILIRALIELLLALGNGFFELIWACQTIWENKQQ